jgi:hypothetical protein
MDDICLPFRTWFASRPRIVMAIMMLRPLSAADMALSFRLCLLPWQGVRVVDDARGTRIDLSRVEVAAHTGATDDGRHGFAIQINALGEILDD